MLYVISVIIGQKVAAWFISGFKSNVNIRGHFRLNTVNVKDIHIIIYLCDNTLAFPPNIILILLLLALPLRLIL